MVQMTTKTQGTGDMPAKEFNQRVALEAVVNGDYSKAFAMRVERTFDDATAYPRAKDSVRVKGVSVETLLAFTDAASFTYDTYEVSGAGVKLTGVEYTKYADEYDCVARDHQ